LKWKAFLLPVRLMRMQAKVINLSENTMVQEETGKGK
jgi:hypothetical protein